MGEPLNETSDAGRERILDESSDELHVIPQADLVEHTPDGGCVCVPRTDVVWRADGSNGWLVVHHALDGRA